MKYIFPLLTILLLPPLYGQQIFGLSYNISIPQGETHDFIENTSYTGFGIEGRQFINEKITLGLSFGWSKFQQESKQFSGNTGEIEEHLLDSFPLLFNGSYFLFGETAGFRPFAGLNTGVYFINARKFSGAGTFQDKSLYFGVAPEIGFLAAMFSDLNMMLFLRYNYNIKFSGSNSYPYLTIHLTFVSISIW